MDWLKTGIPAIRAHNNPYKVNVIAEIFSYLFGRFHSISADS
ncbi:hypothetical protein ACFGVS_17510 [Mucilaginibacter sp. AW1-7]